MRWLDVEFTTDVFQFFFQTISHQFNIQLYYFPIPLQNYFLEVRVRQWELVIMGRMKGLHPGVSKDLVQCPVNGCSKVKMRRDNYVGHMKNKVILGKDNKPVSQFSSLKPQAKTSKITLSCSSVDPSVWTISLILLLWRNMLWRRRTIWTYHQCSRKFNLQQQQQVQKLSQD